MLDAGKYTNWKFSLLIFVAWFCGMILDIEKLTKILVRVASCLRFIPENRSIIRPEVIKGSIHDDVFAESVVEYPRNLSTKSHAVRWVQPNYIPLHSLHLTWRDMFHAVLSIEI